MKGVKQMKFCGAVAGALLIGVCESTQKATSSESKRKEIVHWLLDFIAQLKQYLEPHGVMAFIRADVIYYTNKRGRGSADGTMKELSESLEEVRGRIAAAAKRAGRDPSEVEIIAVTKTHGEDVVREARDAGDRKSTRLNSSHTTRSRMPSSA